MGAAKTDAATQKNNRAAMPPRRGPYSTDGSLDPSLYTRAAVSWNRAARSRGEKSWVMRLNEFQRTV